MSIKLRVNQSQALTYNEMDRNFSSFFYSASVDTTTATLRLHYTGSTSLNTVGEDFSPGRTISIPLNPTEGETPALVVAPPIRGIQFNEDGSQLGGSTNFVYTTQGHLGIGTGAPSQRLHVRGDNTYPAILRLESGTGNSTKRSEVLFYEANTFMGSIGRGDTQNTNHLYIKTYRAGSSGLHGHLIVNIGNSTDSGAWTTTGLGIGTLDPQQALHVEANGYFTGRVGIGTAVDTSALNVFQNTQLQATSGEYVHIAKFGITPLANSTFLNVTAVRTSGGSDWLTEGMRIQNLIDTSYKSYIQFNGHDNLDGFSIGTGNANVGFGDVYNTVPERFRITGTGNVGINTTTPSERLTVQGNISGSGNIKVNGSANIGTSLTTGTSAAVGTTLTVGSTATIMDVPLNTESNPRILVQSQTSGQVGQVQYITGIVPKGAIMMWNSATAPSGWAICDGNGGTPINGVAIPDLRERFIVGAGGDNPGVVTKNYETAQFDLQANTFYGSGSVSLPFNSLANGVYNVVTTGVYHHIPASIVVEGPVGGQPYGERFFVYQKTGSNPYYLIYSTMVSNYILVRGTFAGAGSIPNFTPATSATTTTAGHYFTQSATTMRGVADYGREVSGAWVNGKRPDHVGLYYYDTLGYNVGDRGGFNEVKMEVAQMPSHFHHTPGSVFKSFTAGAGDYGNSSSTGTGTDGANNSQTAIGNLGSNYDANGAALEKTIGGYLPHENRPPYYALAFIIYTGA